MKRSMETPPCSQDVKEEIVEAWYMNDSEKEDYRLPRHCEPKEFVSLEKLQELGVLTWSVHGDDYENEEDVKQIRESEGYSHSVNIHPERMPNFELMVKRFFLEHLHPHPEISYCIQGTGYHDVRDENDRWIRIAVKEGVMILLPAGIYHRFTLDTNNYLKAVLFSAGPPAEFSTYEGPCEDLPARKLYVEAFHKAMRR
ncbi:hypothetical protein ZIOFF_029289 [Zingiber officinale]|uniref:Acireductone dioxygenase n=1 Tax=Zingiber officinale TaxID=94328 RepID=A0A8J5GMH3_ZINOF|nr:hypothetical protein ZIOFF_029289 [Zingiber officinale]